MDRLDLCLRLTSLFQVTSLYALLANTDLSFSTTALLHSERTSPGLAIAVFMMTRREDRYKAVPVDDHDQNNEVQVLSKALAKEKSASNPVIQRSFWKCNIQSFELKILMVIIGGFTVLIGAVIYLTFLWFGQSTGKPWSRIVLHNWVTTSVVITALAMRFVVAAQITILTSMLAVKILRGGVQLQNIPRLSSLRYNNAGPIDLFYTLKSELRQLQPKLALFATLVLTLLALILQFTSTFLTSDLRPAIIETSTNKSVSPFFYDARLRKNAERNDFWTDPLLSNSITFPTFAEEIITSVEKRISTEPPLDDTGPIVRAILPLTEEHGRSNIRSFQGTASVYDARWSCTRPRFNISTLRLQGSGTRQTLTGLVVPERTSPLLPKHSLPNGFSCYLETMFSSRNLGPMWRLVTCNLLQEGLNDSLGKYIAELSPTRYGYSGDGQSYLVINMTNYKLTSGFPVIDTSVDLTTDWTASANRVWTTLSSSQKGLNVTYDERFAARNGVNSSSMSVWDFQLDISYCSSANGMLKNIHIDAQGQAQEPVSVTKGMGQLGLTLQTVNRDRAGILKLDSGFWDKLKQDRDNMVAWNMTQGRISSQELLSDNSDILLGSCRAWYYYPSGNGSCLGVHETRAELFQRSLRETGSLALAMQGAAHAAITERYYKNQPYFTNDTISITTFTTIAIQPVHIRGYLIVIVALLLYAAVTLLMLLVIGACNDWRDMVTTTGQSWQTYAQVYTLRQEINDLSYSPLEMTVKTDEQVREEIKKQDLENDIFMLLQDESGHRIFRRKKAGSLASSSRDLRGGICGRL